MEADRAVYAGCMAQDSVFVTSRTARHMMYSSRSGIEGTEDGSKEADATGGLAGRSGPPLSESGGFAMAVLLDVDRWQVRRLHEYTVLIGN